MNPIHPGKLIMLFIPSDKVFLHFQKLLEAANYNVVRTTTVQGAIQKIIEFSPDMIVDGSYSFEYPNFQSYILLNRTTINHSIPYIVYIEKIRLDLIQTGLALGIDNFLFAPLDDKLIVSKVKLLLKKVDKHQISDKIRFEKIFHTSPLGMLIGNSERLERGNPAFYKLSGLLKNSSIPKLEDLFEISHDPVILNKIRNCLKGLIEEYVVSDISFNAPQKCKVNLHISSPGKLLACHALIQIEVAESVLKPAYPENIQTINEDLDLPKLNCYRLTLREHKVLKISSKGKPVKLIASELGISQKTVEKHRSNIMRKTSSSNIIEAIDKVYGMHGSILN